MALSLMNLRLDTLRHSNVMHKDIIND
jgi:hypothetical protein